MAFSLSDLSAADRRSLIAQLKEEEKSARLAIAEPGIHDNVPLTDAEIGCNTLAKIVHTLDDGGSITWLARMAKQGDAEPTINLKTSNGFSPGITGDAERIGAIIDAASSEGPGIVKRLAAAYRKGAKAHVWIAKPKRK